MISFRVFGHPKPKGSKRGFVVQKAGERPRAVMVEQAGQPLKDWMALVNEKAQACAEEAQADPAYQNGAFEVHIGFYMPRPKNHYRANGEIKENAPSWHTKMPDIDKCVRGVLDVLTGPLFRDDSQVAVLSASQTYELKDRRAGAYVSVKALP